MAIGVKSISQTFVWILLGLLIVGLAGFGATNMSGTVTTVGQAGDQQITVDEYARELQREIRAIEARTRQPLQMTQVAQLGLDQAVLARLVALASLDHEVSELGLSVGDEVLQSEIVQIDAFQGISGGFDRDTYRFALSQAGIRERDFEDDLRAEAARTLVQGAIVSGVQMPQTLANTMLDYVGARRTFTWAKLEADTLDAPIPEPSEGDLRGFYDENPDLFQLPETKRLTYVLLTPDMILDQVELDDAAVRTLYDDRKAEYDLPERRLVERLVFADQTAAEQARAQLDVGGTTFPILVQERGLELDDVDLGDVERSDLDATTADAVFDAAAGDIIGPLPSDLGPALFRINGVLDARVTPFEDVADELRDELAGDSARRQIEVQAQNFDDLLAGGATLEELAEESDMQLNTLDWTPDAAEDAAAYVGFNRTASTVTLEDFPSISYLDDGGIFALRLDDVLPPRPEPFDDARSAVTDGWVVAQTEAALGEKAAALLPELATSGDFAAAGLAAQIEEGLVRTAFIEGTPPNFLVDVFEMSKGDLKIITGGEAVMIVRLDDELPPEATSELGDLRRAISQQVDQSLANALFQAFVNDAQSRANPRIDQQALNAVQAGMGQPGHGGM